MCVSTDSEERERRQREEEAEGGRHCYNGHKFKNNRDPLPVPPPRGRVRGKRWVSPNAELLGSAACQRHDNSAGVPSATPKQLRKVAVGAALTNSRRSVTSAKVPKAPFKALCLCPLPLVMSGVTSQISEPERGGRYTHPSCYSCPSNHGLYLGRSR